MRSRPLLLVAAAATATAVLGALLGSRPALVVGSLVALLVLAGDPALRDVPRPTRLLLWAGIACVGGVVLVTAWNWADAGAPWTAEDFRGAWKAPLAFAVLEASACVCLGVAVAHAPRERLQQQGPALLAVVGLLALGALAWVDAWTAWNSRPHFDDDLAVFVVAGVRTTGPSLDVFGALTMGTMLAGAALTVLACARLSR
ncbi:hypothetical protein ACQPZX_39680 [Actinoplanes sp. CA-142083]|uniref:hypothetical protein n=1 Tax=Actinoplanes sp. CA-142083 TaxID=3239903 RepID=UPI003D8E743C